LQAENSVKVFQSRCAITNLVIDAKTVLAKRPSGPPGPKPFVQLQDEVNRLPREITAVLLPSKLNIWISSVVEIRNFAGLLMSIVMMILTITITGMIQLEQRIILSHRLGLGRRGSLSLHLMVMKSMSLSVRTRRGRLLK
jgi:hypothetical protein